MNLKTAIGVVAGIAVVALFFWFGVPDSLQSSQQASVLSSSELAALESRLTSSVSDDQFVEAVPGLKIATLVRGEGEEVASGDMVAVHYIGTFIDGTEFDSSLKRGQPIEFQFNTQEIIPGFEQGMVGMRVGEYRRIIVPSELGYGSTGVTSPDGTVIIPPDATLVFDVALVSVTKK
ncbi:MAG TPA: FKBP-type peptidyl-prolyl cis-trans isomerase [Candidatus Paceibacterota bacterium]